MKHTAKRLQEALLFFMLAVLVGFILERTVSTLPMIDCVALTLADDCAAENTMDFLNHPPLGWVNLTAIFGVLMGICGVVSGVSVFSSERWGSE